MNRDMVVALLMILIALLLFADLSQGHGIHLSDVQNINNGCTSVAGGWVEGVGFVWSTDCDGDGLPDAFWLVDMKGSLAHRDTLKLHVVPLTEETAKTLFEKDRIKGGN